MKLVTGSSSFTALELVEVGLTLLCLLLAILHPGAGNGFFSHIEDVLRRIARRRALVFGILIALPLVLRLLLLPVYGVPTPFVHDEYGYLLQADTFASGRLTNPTPPLPKHFESIYILTEPTYTSQYQPAQGLLLAFGMRLANCPWLGVFLSVGVLSALFYWMLEAWLPPVWALLGVLLAIAQYAVLSYWMNSYFGGTVPAIGGTLVLGALARLRDGPSIRNAVLCGTGIVILMASRPAEGVLLLLVTAGALLTWIFIRPVLPIGETFRLVFVPMAVVLTFGAGFLLFYNYRVTGTATELPYVLSRNRYGVQGYFWQKPYRVTTPMPRDIRMEYEKQLQNHARRESLGGLVRATAGKVRAFWTFYLGPALTVPLLFFPFIWRRPKMGIVAASLILVALDILSFSAFQAHYSAPVAGLVLLVVVLCLERMRHMGRGGLLLSRSVPFICAAGLVIPIAGRLIQPILPAQLSRLTRLWNSEFHSPWPRERIREQLIQEGGKHLVLVRYRYPEHNLDNEWVFNRADLDHARVIWARELDVPSNRLLLERFKGRKVWLGEPDTVPPKIVLYRQLSSAGPSAP